MSEVSCIMMDRQEFFTKLDVLLIDNKNAFMIMVFLPHESLIKQQLSKDDEEKLILDGWQKFCQNFPFVCYYIRLDWRTYFILLEDESIKIITSVKKIFNVWEGCLYSNLWRIAFTNLKESKAQTRNMAADFQNIAVKAANYNPTEKLFQIHIDEKSQTPISLS